LSGYLFGLAVGHIGEHDLSGGVGGELLVHKGQPPSGLGFGGEIRGDVIVDHHLVNRAAAKEHRRQEDQKEGLSLVDNEPRQLGYRGFRA